MIKGNVLYLVGMQVNVSAPRRTVYPWSLCTPLPLLPPETEHDRQSHWLARDWTDRQQKSPVMNRTTGGREWPRTLLSLEKGRKGGKAFMDQKATEAGGWT